MSQNAVASAVDFANTEKAFAAKNDSELKRMERLFRLMNNSLLVSAASSLGLRALRVGLPFTESIIQRTIFDIFCGGTSLMDAQDSIDQLWDHRILTVLDFGAEGKTTESDFEYVYSETMKAIRFASAAPNVPVVSCKITGLADDDLLAKWQSESYLSRAEEEAFARVEKRLDDICLAAKEGGVKIFIDAEESWMQKTIDHLVNAMMKRYNSEQAVVYNTFQLYRHDRLDFLKASYVRAQEEGYFLGAKLVRGAYMEKERVRAEELGYQSPIHATKADVDRDFDTAVSFCVERFRQIASCNASHNFESNLLQAKLIAEQELPRNHPHLNFCQLYGMSDYITYNLADAGYNVAKYVVYGPVREVARYLIRRAQENTSVTGDMSRELSLITKELKRRGLRV